MRVPTLFRRVADVGRGTVDVDVKRAARSEY